MVAGTAGSVGLIPVSPSLVWRNPSEPILDSAIWTDDESGLYYFVYELG